MRQARIKVDPEALGPAARLDLRSFMLHGRSVPTKRPIPPATRLKTSHVVMQRPAAPKKDPKPLTPVATNSPLRLDTALINQARSAGELSDRSATAQIEHWAKIGRAVESVLSGDSVTTLKRISRVDDLSQILAFSQTPAGRAKAERIISRSGIATYGTDPRFPGYIMQHNPDGTVRKGRFIKRQFVAAD